MNKMLGVYKKLNFISFSSKTLVNQNIFLCEYICRNRHQLVVCQHQNPHSDPYPGILKFM